MYSVDVKSFESIRLVIVVVVGYFGLIEVLLFSYGVFRVFIFDDLIIEDFDYIFDINLKGNIYIIKVVLFYIKFSKVVLVVIFIFFF